MPRQKNKGTYAKVTEQKGPHLCVTCQRDVAEDASIACDSCERWIHTTEMCTGLPRKLLDALVEHDGSGINFLCTLCRISKQKGASSSSQSQGPMMVELIMQLFQQIQGICMNPQALTEQARASPGLTEAPGAAPSTQNQNPVPPTPPASAEYRTAIREEVRELAERDKRKHSVIIKGLGASTPRDMTLKFKRLTSEVMDKTVEVTEVTAIPNHP